MQTPGMEGWDTVMNILGKVKSGEVLKVTIHFASEDIVPCILNNLSIEDHKFIEYISEKCLLIMSSDTDWIEYSDEDEIWESESDQEVNNNHSLDDVRYVPKPERIAQLDNLPNEIEPINEIQNEEQAIAANEFAQYLDSIQDNGYLSQ